MEEQKLLPPSEIARKIKEVIDGVLAVGDWESSIFLKASAAKLKGFLVKAEKLSHFGGQKKQHDDAIGKVVEQGATPSGYVQVFILLYQVDSDNLQGWYRNIKTLTDYSVTRPAYKEEIHAKEFIRSKTSGIERNGYVVVNVKEENFYNEEKAPEDAYGHQLFALKENSVKLENIVEFVHANKKHYAIRDAALVLLDEIK